MKRTKAPITAKPEKPPRIRRTPRGIPIYCKFDCLAIASGLRPTPGNPNKHPAAQIKKGKKLIERNGWQHPIVVSKLSGCIVIGHGRAEIGRAMNDSVPIVYRDFESPDHERAVMLADNQLGLESEIDNTLLLEQLKAMPRELVEFTGYDTALLDSLMKPADEPAQKPPAPPKPAKLRYTITFDNEEQQTRFTNWINVTLKMQHAGAKTHAERIDAHVMGELVKAGGDNVPQS